MAAASRRRHIDISAHLTPDELALLAEGKAGEAAEKFRSHLAHCKSCFGAYQEAVEFHARALAGKEPHAPPELVQNGRNVPVRRGKKRGVTRAPRAKMILATVGGFVALAAVWIFLGPGHTQEPSSILSADDVAEFRNLNAQASEQGLVFPEASEGNSGPTFRGVATLPSGLAPAVERLRTQASENNINPDDLFWLISAELATDNLAMADTHLQHAPLDSDVRFLKLKAILEYRKSNLTAAEKDLRNVLKKNPNDDEAMLNLGLVLATDPRNSSKAQEALEKARASNSPQIHKRAGLALNSLPFHSP